MCLRFRCDGAETGARPSLQRRAHAARRGCGRNRRTADREGSPGRRPADARKRMNLPSAMAGHDRAPAGNGFWPGYGTDGNPRRSVLIDADIGLRRGLKHGVETILKHSPRGERIGPGRAQPLAYPTHAPGATVARPAQQPLSACVSPSESSGRRCAQRGRRACASAMTSQFSRCSAQASASSSPTRASQPADWVERSETLDVCMTKPHVGGELGITLIIAKRLRLVKCDFVI